MWPCDKLGPMECRQKYFVAVSGNIPKDRVFVLPFPACLCLAVLTSDGGLLRISQRGKDWGTDPVVTYPALNSWAVQR